MTGYGSASATAEETSVTVELRTVNHRFLDLHVRLPRDFAYLEQQVQQAVRERVSRGRVDIHIGIQSTGAGEMEIDEDQARVYYDAAQRLGAQFRLVDRLDLRTLVGLPGVLRPKNAAEAGSQNAGLASLVLESVRGALGEVIRMREREGEALGGDLRERLNSIAVHLSRIRELAPKLAGTYRTKLQERLSRLVPGNGLDPGRLEQEVAILAGKADISEEVTRLESHLKQFSGWVSSSGEIGKKMEFLLQEMHREISTILAKAEDVDISRAGIEIKSEIEKAREQVQNIE